MSKGQVRVDPDLSETDKQSLKTLLSEYEDCFVFKDSYLGLCNYLQLEKKLIDENSILIKQKLYPYSKPINEIINNKINDWLKMGIVEDC